MSAQAEPKSGHPARIVVQDQTTELPPALIIFQMIQGLWVSRALYVAAQAFAIAVA